MYHLCAASATTSHTFIKRGGGRRASKKGGIGSLLFSLHQRFTKVSVFVLITEMQMMYEGMLADDASWTAYVYIQTGCVQVLLLLLLLFTLIALLFFFFFTYFSRYERDDAIYSCLPHHFLFLYKHTGLSTSSSRNRLSLSSSIYTRRQGLPPVGVSFLSSSSSFPSAYQSSSSSSFSSKNNPLLFFLHHRGGGGEGGRRMMTTTTSSSASSSSIARKLWEDQLPMASAILHHPFVKGIGQVGR